MSRETLEHVVRPPLPWRASDKTVCGRAVTDVEVVVTLAEMTAKVKREGKARAAYTSCMTCWDNSTRHQFGWAESPSTVLWDHAYQGVWMHYRAPTAPTLLDRELWAIAALVAEHRDQFDALVAAMGETGGLAERREARRAKGRWPQ